VATQRYISTSFWDDRWIRSLNPADRYLYLYLMTNPLTNIAGVYEITLDRIAFDTGYDERTLRPMLEKFAAAGKAYFYQDEWIVLPAWPEHQQWKRRSKIKDGIVSILEKLPSDLLGYMIQVGYRYPIDTLSVPYTYPPNYSDSDSDSDLDTDTDTDLSRSTPSAEADASREVSTSTAKGKQRDELAQMWEKALTAIQPSSTWGNYGKERKQCKALASRTRELVEQTPYDTHAELMQAVLSQYDTLKRKGRSEYWTGAPWTPSGVIARWPQVWQELAKSHGVEEAMIF
jgi:hypothetical protein